MIFLIVVRVVLFNLVCSVKQNPPVDKCALVSFHNFGINMQLHIVST